MVTNYPQQLTAASEVTHKETVEAGRDGPDGDRGSARSSAVFTAMTAVLHFEGSRVMMRCTSCGHDTPGWEISGQGPRLRYAGDVTPAHAQAAPGATQERLDTPAVG